MLLTHTQFDFSETCTLFRVFNSSSLIYYFYLIESVSPAFDINQLFTVSKLSIVTSSFAKIIAMKLQLISRTVTYEYVPVDCLTQPAAYVKNVIEMPSKILSKLKHIGSRSVLF